MKKPPPLNFSEAAKRGAYVYCYLRGKESKTAGAGTPYYIGVGSTRHRPYDKNHVVSIPENRSLIRIMRYDLTWEEALEWECFYIKLYGRKDVNTGILCNLTDGGEGAKGAVRSESFKENLRQRMLGNKLTEEQRQKIREARLGSKLTPETKAKLSLASKGKTQSPEWIEKRMAAHRGAKRTEATRALISEKAQGRRSPAVAAANSRRIWDEAARQRHSEAMKLAAAKRRQAKIHANVA